MVPPNKGLKIFIANDWVYAPFAKATSYSHCVCVCVCVIFFFCALKLVACLWLYALATVLLLYDSNPNTIDSPN